MGVVCMVGVVGIVGVVLISTHLFLVSIVSIVVNLLVELFGQLLIKLLLVVAHGGLLGLQRGGGGGGGDSPLAKAIGSGRPVRLCAQCVLLVAQCVSPPMALLVRLSAAMVRFYVQANRSIP